MDPLAAVLTRFSRLNAVTLGQHLGALGITTSEASVLASLDLAPEGVLAPSRLQGLVIQSPGGITKTLRRLEEAGLIERRLDPDDRRALLVVLTEKGRSVARQAIDRAEEHYADVLVDLDAGDRADLQRLLRTALDRLEAATGREVTRLSDG